VRQAQILLAAIDFANRQSRHLVLTTAPPARRVQHDDA
jgi:hypothetical protein